VKSILTLFVVLSVACAVSLKAGCAFATDEELPSPKTEAAKPAVKVQAERAPPEAALEEESEPVVVGNLEHEGWALSGSRGRHYFFGGLAIADYSYQGERQIVTLQQEEPTLLPKPDPHFLYYRELHSGHRWAVAREPLRDGSYVVFYQRKGAEKSADPKKAWKEFQRAQLEWKKDDVKKGTGGSHEKTKDTGAWRSR
jgi:hypothetical protein